MAVTDFLQKLRLQNIFGNMGQTDPTFPGSYGGEAIPSPTPPMMPSQEGSPFDVTARMRELYNPETESIDKFNAMTDQYPTYERPGMLKRIGAVALGTLGDAFGPQGAGRIAFNEMSGLAPHERKVKDWQNQIDPLKDAANIERQSNTNNRTMAYQTIAAELRQRADEARANNNAVKAQIAQQRADVYEFKTMNPNARIIAQKGGNILAVHPVTLETIRDFGPSGEMTDAELEGLRQTNSLERISASGKVSSNLEEQRQGNREEIEGIRQGNRITLRQTPTAAQADDDELATQTRVREFNAARQVANTSPELKQFIKFGSPGTNDFEITPPSERWYGRTGPTPEQYKELIRMIYPTRYQELYGQEGQVAELPAPSRTPPVVPGPTTNVPPPTSGGRSTGAGPRSGGPNTQQAPPAPAGWKYVPKPGGGWTAVRVGE